MTMPPSVDGDNGEIRPRAFVPCSPHRSWGTLRGVEDSTSVEVSVARFRALGDPTRLRIVRELSAETLCVCVLRDRLGVQGPLLSHHLAVLRNAGLITAARRGRWIDYRLDPDALAALAEALAADLTRVPT